MGLAILRSIVEADGGKIQAENVIDGGASFYFTLPVTDLLIARGKPRHINSRRRHWFPFFHPSGASGLSEILPGKTTL